MNWMVFLPLNAFLNLLVELPLDHSRIIWMSMNVDLPGCLSSTTPLPAQAMLCSMLCSLAGLICWGPCRCSQEIVARQLDHMCKFHKKSGRGRV